MPIFSAPSAQTPVAGFTSATATTSAATLITIPPGRTWVGTVTISCSSTASAGSAVTGSAVGTVQTASTGAVLPPVGNILGCVAQAAANAATGLSGSGSSNTVSAVVTVVSPVGSTTKLTTTVTISGSSGQVMSSANGVLQ